MKTELIIPQSYQLDKIVLDSKLELNEGEQIKQSYLPYFIELAEIKEQAKKINFENPTELDEKIARELRLKTVKVRTGSEALKDDRKKIHLLKGNLEQDAWNLIKSTCALEEAQFTQVEKRRDNIEKQRIELLKTERLAELQPYSEFVPMGIDLGGMADDDFGKLLSGAKLQLQAKTEADAKAEADRIEKEKAEASERERVRLENEKLKAEAVAMEMEIEAERKKAAEEKAKSDAKAKAERELADKKLVKERAESEAKLKAEREAREKAEAEIKAKADAELKAKKESEAKAAAEEKARIKAAKAPIKKRAKEWVLSFSIPQGQPDNDICASIVDKFNSFKVWAEKEADKI